MKKLFSRVSYNEAIYVVLHAQYRRHRGKKPSCAFRGERNPRKALWAAVEALRNPEERVVPSNLQSREEIEKKIGYDLVTASELREAIKYLRFAQLVYN